LPIPIISGLKMKKDLEVLGNGLVICHIEVITPLKSGQNKIHLKALVDTGAEISFICKTVYEQMVVNEAMKGKIGASTLDAEIDDFITYPMKIRIYSDYANWTILDEEFLMTVRDLTKRKEYQAIIGADILKHLSFVYNGVEGRAWFNE